MAPVVIVTDSSACLPDTVLGHTALRVLPIGIVVGGRRIRDGRESEPVVRSALAAGEPVRTTSPSPVDYLRATEGAGAGVVVVTPASEFAVMHRNAVLAARLADGPVEVVDTRSAAAAHGLAVTAGLDALDAGAELPEVAAAVRAAAGNLRLLAAVPARAAGAAVPARAAGAAVPAHAAGRTTSRVTGPPSPRAGPPPVFELRDGAVVPVDAPDGADPVEILVHAWRAAPGAAQRRTAAFHDGDGPGIDRLRAGLLDQAVLVRVSPALAVHMGAGCMGVAWHEHVAP